HPYRTGPGGAAGAHDRDGLLGQHRAQAVLQVPQEPARPAARRAGRRRPCGRRARCAHGTPAGRDPPALAELADGAGPRLLTARPAPTVTAATARPIMATCRNRREADVY